MAKNWSMKEATSEILAGNKEAILDIGKRFPLTANAIATMGKNEGAITIINALPEHISVRKIETVLKDGVQEIEDDEVKEVSEDDSESEVKPKRERKSKKERTSRKERRSRKAKEVVEEAAEEDEIPEELMEEPSLEDMTEVELFKLAKSKGLKPAPKQSKEYYIGLLNPTEESESVDEDDDWDDEEEEVKPVKKERKSKAKKEKKAAVKEEDEEDDWDI